MATGMLNRHAHQIAVLVQIDVHVVRDGARLLDGAEPSVEESVVDRLAIFQ